MNIMSYNKLLFAASLMLSISLSAYSAEDPRIKAETIIRQANLKYSEGYFNHALELYYEAINLGVESAELYYNTGNTYFKLGKYPQAIINYERALRLQPGDENTRFNLQLANLRIVDKIEPLPEMFYLRWWRALINMNHADVWGRWAIILLAGSLLTAVLYLISMRKLIKQTAFYSSLLMFFISIMFLVLAYSSHYHRIKRNEAIVIKPSLTVKSAPNENSTDLFVIHEGTKVLITDQLGEWKEIRIANGNRGWSRMEAIEII